MVDILGSWGEAESYEGKAGLTGVQAVLHILVQVLYHFTEYRCRRKVWSRNGHSKNPPRARGRTCPIRSIHTEVQAISFVGYTGVEGGRPRLWNLQNLWPAPP